MILRGSLLGASFTAAVLGALVGLDACGSSKLAGPGGECFVATDCQTGLVCIEQKDKSRICTNDLTGALGSVPPEASVPDAGDAEASTGEGGEPLKDAAEPKDQATTPQKDSSTPPPQDSGGD